MRRHFRLLALLVVASGMAPALAATPTVAAGNSHNVALHADGTVRTWGDDSAGQLGLGRTLSAPAPAPVLGLTNVSRVAAGWNHVVALMRDGSVRSWGLNKLGQLGDGTTTSRSSPAPVPGLAGVTRVSA